MKTLILILLSFSSFFSMAFASPTIIHGIKCVDQVAIYDLWESTERLRPWPHRTEDGFLDLNFDSRLDRFPSKEVLQNAVGKRLTSISPKLKNQVFKKLLSLGPSRFESVSFLEGARPKDSPLFLPGGCALMTLAAYTKGENPRFYFSDKLKRKEKRAVRRYTLLKFSLSSVFEKNFLYWSEVRGRQLMGCLLSEENCFFDITLENMTEVTYCQSEKIDFSLMKDLSGQWSVRVFRIGDEEYGVQGLYWRAYISYSNDELTHLRQVRITKTPLSHYGAGLILGDFDFSIKLKKSGEVTVWVDSLRSWISGKNLIEKGTAINCL